MSNTILSGHQAGQPYSTAPYRMGGIHIENSRTSSDCAPLLAPPITPEPLSDEAKMDRPETTIDDAASVLVDKHPDERFQSVGKTAHHAKNQARWHCLLANRSDAALRRSTNSWP